MSLSDSILEKILNYSNQGIEPIIYHYTRIRSALGIISNAEIWATRISCLNDKSELIESLEFLMNIFNEKHKKCSDEEEDKYYNEMIEECINDLVYSKIYLCSFCRDDGDTLSQWRAYGGNSVGLSIGFDKEHLSKIAKDRKLLLAPCRYIQEEKEELAKFLFEVTVEYLHKEEAFQKRDDPSY